MRKPSGPRSKHFENLLQVALKNLTDVTGQAEAEAMVQRASRAVWRRKISIICVVHRHTKCQCDQPATKTVTLKVMTGGANDVGTSSAELRVVVGKKR
jgi:hypothetical protein